MLCRGNLHGKKLYKNSSLCSLLFLDRHYARVRDVLAAAFSRESSAADALDIISSCYVYLCLNLPRVFTLTGRLRDCVQFLREHIIAPCMPLPSSVHDVMMMSLAKIQLAHKAVDDVGPSLQALGSQSRLNAQRPSITRQITVGRTSNKKDPNEFTPSQCAEEAALVFMSVIFSVV